MSKVSRTIQVSDTIDQYARRIHVNIRGEKVTMVHRWKDRKSDKAHTQRITLTDEQAAKLLVVLVTQTDKAVQSNPERHEAFKKTFEAELKANLFLQ